MSWKLKEKKMFRHVKKVSKQWESTVWILTKFCWKGSHQQIHQKCKLDRYIESKSFLVPSICTYLLVSCQKLHTRENFFFSSKDNIPRQWRLYWLTLNADGDWLIKLAKCKVWQSLKSSIAELRVGAGDSGLWLRPRETSQSQSWACHTTTTSSITTQMTCHTTRLTHR